MHVSGPLFISIPCDFSYHDALCLFHMVANLPQRTLNRSTEKGA